MELVHRTILKDGKIKMVPWFENTEATFHGIWCPKSKKLKVYKHNKLLSTSRIPLTQEQAEYMISEYHKIFRKNTKGW